MAYTNVSSFDLGYDQVMILESGSAVVKFRDRDTIINMHFASLETALTVMRAAVNDITVYLQAKEEE